MRRRHARRALAAVLPLVVLHTVLWLVASAWVDVTFDAHEFRLRERGWKIDHGAKQHGGWPFAARIAVADLRLVQGTGNQSWQSAGFEVSFDARHPTRVDVTLAGPHVASIPGYTPVQISGPPIHAEITLRDLPQTRVMARDLHLRTAAGIVALGAMDILVEHDPRSSRPMDSVLLHGTAEELDLGGLLPSSAMGSRFEQISLGAGFTGLRIPRPEPRAWREAGGRLTIDRLAFRWGRLDFELGGVFGLDAKLQPEGSGMMAAGGLPEAIDAMVGAGMIPPGSARTAKALLMLLPRTPDGKLTLPIALKNRTVSAARLPVGVIPEIGWQ